MQGGEYIPTVLPTDTDGTDGNPQWTVEAAEGSVAAVVENILSASTMDAIDKNALVWTLGMKGSASMGAPTSAWMVSPSVGSTIDFCIKVNDGKDNSPHDVSVRGGFQIAVGDGRHLAAFSFGVTGISVFAESNLSKNGPDNSVFKAYRIVIKDGSAALYEEGNETPLLSDVRMKPLPNYNLIYFGDISSAVSGSYDLAYLRWTNEKADFTPPPKFESKNRP